MDTGTIPPVHNLTKLTIFLGLTLSSLMQLPGISGTLPRDLPSSLSVLAFIGESISGTVPDSFSKPMVLLSLYTEWSSGFISGTMPGTWYSTDQLRSIVFVNSELSGTIGSLDYLSNLESLMLYNGALFGSQRYAGHVSGSIPPLDNALNLSYLAMNVNAISGSSPVALLSLPKLQVLWLCQTPCSGV